MSIPDSTDRQLRQRKVPVVYTPLPAICYGRLQYPVVSLSARSHSSSESSEATGSNRRTAGTGRTRTASAPSGQQKGATPSKRKVAVVHVSKGSKPAAEQVRQSNSERSRVAAPAAKRKASDEKGQWNLFERNCVQVHCRNIWFMRMKVLPSSFCCCC